MSAPSYAASRRRPCSLQLQAALLIAALLAPLRVARAESPARKPAETKLDVDDGKAPKLVPPENIESLIFFSERARKKKLTQKYSWSGRGPKANWF